MLALSTPRFPPLETPNTRLSLKCPIPEWEAQYSDDTKQEDDSTSLLVSTGQGEFQNDITNVFQGLQQLSRTLAAVRSSKTKHLDALVFIDKVLVLERQLLLSLISNDLPHTSPLDTFILQSCTHAAFIYIYSTLHTTIRDLPLRSPFFGILIGRLRTALDHSGFLLAWSHTNPIMLLWVLVVGAAAAYRRPQRPWFVTQLTGVCAILNIQGLEEMRLSLRKMMWVDGALDSTLKDLWPELQFQWG